MNRPNHFSIVSASAEGKNELTAFDAALLAAGVGNLNLLRVSSILPPSMTQDDELNTLPPPGSLLPIAYGSIASDVAGQIISAAVGIGLGGESEYGVIMECSGIGPKKDRHVQIENMLEEAFGARGRDLERVIVRSAEHTVERIGCVFAAVPMWWCAK